MGTNLHIHRYFVLTLCYSYIYKTRFFTLHLLLQMRNRKLLTKQIIYVLPEPPHIENKKAKTFPIWLNLCVHNNVMLFPIFLTPLFSTIWKPFYYLHVSHIWVLVIEFNLDPALLRKFQINSSNLFHCSYCDVFVPTSNMYTIVNVQWSGHTKVL